MRPSFRSCRMPRDVLYIAEGKWSKEIENFAPWSLRYDMWCKMHYFGEQMNLQMAGADAQAVRISERKKKSNAGLSEA